MEATRRTWLAKVGFVFAGMCLGAFKTFASPARQHNDGLNKNVPHKGLEPAGEIQPGAFSVSLNVKDLNASRTFYENLGFTVFGGGASNNYYIMKNGNALIGLFYGMFDKTILTFNPGWDENAKKIEGHQDIREIQQKLKSRGVTFLSAADEKTSGAASFMLTDPDGNQILFDQHI